jgi:hypothetical protein
MLQYISHKQWKAMLLKRLREARHLTGLAYDRNKIHLNNRAKELSQLADGYNAMSDIMMPNRAESSSRMAESYEKESEGGKYSL